MALFGRGKNNIDNVPQEVRDYYESERRERSGVAWLLALATLVVTLVLAGGIFLGGRWAYRQVVNRNEPARVANNDAQEENSNNQQQQPADEQRDNNQSNDQNQQNQNNQQGQPADNTDQNDNQPQPSAPAAGQSGNSGSTGSSSGSNAGTSGTPTTGTSSTSTSTPSGSSESSAQPSNLTNTGPADTLGVFLAVTVFATIAHYYITSRRNRASA